MRLRWHFQTESPRGPEIDDQLEFRGLYDRQVGGLFTPENATRAYVMHRAAITPEPPNRAAAAHTHILNSNQTAKATAEIFKYDFFIPTLHRPLKFFNFQK